MKNEKKEIELQQKNEKKEETKKEFIKLFNEGKKIISKMKFKGVENKKLKRIQHEKAIQFVKRKLYIKRKLKESEIENEIKKKKVFYKKIYILLFLNSQILAERSESQKQRLLLI